jgi:hypothetical protein
MTVFWDVAPYSLVEIYRSFRGACCLHNQGDKSIVYPFIAQHYEELSGYLI